MPIYNPIPKSQAEACFNVERASLVEAERNLQFIEDNNIRTTKSKLLSEIHNLINNSPSLLVNTADVMNLMPQI